MVKNNVGNVLALDIATKTGYYIETHDGKPTVKPTSIKFSGINREKGLFDFLNELIDRYNIQVITYENAEFQPSLQSRRVFAHLRGVVHVIAQIKDIERVVPLDVKTIKKVFTGNGNAKKQDIIDRCKELKVDVGNDNDAADAYAIMYTYKTLIKLSNSIKL